MDKLKLSGDGWSLLRPSWDEWFLKIATVVAERATCTRRRYGAVLVKDHKIISTGYCGAPRGDQNCCDSDKKCKRTELGFGPGKGYDHCVSVHAEQNAIINAGVDKAMGATLYVAGIDAKTGEQVSGTPCSKCIPFIKNAGIARIVFNLSDGTEMEIEREKR